MLAGEIYCASRIDNSKPVRKQDFLSNTSMVILKQKGKLRRTFHNSIKPISTTIITFDVESIRTTRPSTSIDWYLGSISWWLSKIYIDHILSNSAMSWPYCGDCKPPGNTQNLTFSEISIFLAANDFIWRTLFSVELKPSFPSFAAEWYLAFPSRIMFLLRVLCLHDDFWVAAS